MNKYYGYQNIAYWDRATESTNDFKSGVIALAKEERWVAPYYDFEHMVHTKTGKNMIGAAELEVLFNDVRDPGLKAIWTEKGLDYTVHEKKGETWISFVPKSAYESSKKYPVMLCFRPASGNWGVFAQGFYYDLIEIAAQDEMIILMFSTEDADANELFLDILEEAKESYPIDPSRVYVTGHSHYGDFALNFMKNHPGIIAGVAQQGDYPGMHNGASDELMELMHSVDMPLIDVAGTAEMTRMFPLNTDAPELETYTNPHTSGRFPGKCNDRVKSWQKRLYTARCPVISEEEILAAKNGTRAEQALGFPADHSETMFVDGLEVYIADIKNVDGKYHLRIAAVENLSHTTCTFMHTLTWSYLRRFARNLETGEVIELYQ